MAETEMTEDSYTEEYVCVEEYFPLDLHEEEVVAEPLDGQEITIIQPIDSHEILHADSIIVESYDPGDPAQWTTEEVNEIVIDNNEEEPAPATAVIKLENDAVQTHVYECYKCAKRFNYKDKLFKHMKLHHARGDDMMIERDGKRIWTCTQCDKTFISRKGSIIHQRTHTGERPYSCSTCEKRFIDSSTLMKHQVIHQAVRPFTCLLCRRGFNQKVALQRHERTHGQIAPTFKCKYCPKTFLVGSSLQAHEKIHSGIKPYTCQYCPSRFHTSAAQRQHERVHTNERPYSCSYCPKAFKDSGTLFKHQVIHSGIRPFVCPICSQGFTQKVALRKHIRSHVTRNRDNICEVCDTPFFSKDDLCTHIEDHIEQHPSISQVKIIATSSSKNKQELMVAEKAEDDPLSPKENTGSGDMSDLATLCDVAISTAGDMARTYDCVHCGMSFRRLKFLNSHLAIHREGGSGALNCKNCNRLFPDSRSLQIHEKRFCPKKEDGDKKIVTATGPNATVVASISAQSLEKVSAKQADIASSMKNPKRFFYCDQCDKTFSSRNGYIIHQRSHTGERPYPCRWCEKAFGDSATRHKHERIHTGERPFECPRCPRAFNQRAALRAHQVTHTVDRAYICKFCPSSFPYFATLKRHQQSCHTNIPCPLCAVSASEPKKLGAHIKTVHPFIDNPQCTLCDSGKFADQTEFVEHMVWHGKQQQTEPRSENEAEKDVQFEVVAVSDSLIKDEDIEEAIPEVIEGVEEVYTEDTYSVSYMDGYSEEVYTEVDSVTKEEIVEQTVVTDFDVDTSTTVSIDISSQSFCCDVCHAEFNEKEALQEHVPLHF